MRYLWLSALLCLGCRDAGFYEPDLGGDDLSVTDLGSGNDIAVEDLTPPPPDLTDVDGPPEPILQPGAANRFLISGTLMLPTGPTSGELLVEGDTITCVGSCSGMAAAAGATVIRTAGLVIPGLLDAHNHGLFDIFDESDWTPTKLYMNHKQWTSEVRYSQMIDAKQYLDSETSGSTIDVNCEMDKYTEVKALVAATTSILIAPGTSRTCYSSLARTIDTGENGLGSDKIRTSIAVPSTSTTTSVCSGYASGATNAFVVHVGEGIDSTAKNEFSSLAALNSGCLLAPQTTIVHGTAFDNTEFSQMAAHNMRLVWSPKSNVFLYGATAHIDLALAAGVQVIALAPDWSLGGSINMLDELAFASAWDDAHMGNVLTDERLFDMVTIDAARALGVDAQLGSLEVGKRADLALVAGNPADAYRSIVHLRPAGVQLVMVNGLVLYGDGALVAAGPATPGCDTLNVCGTSKFVCAAESDTTNKLNQTFPEIKQALTDALSQYDAMVAPMGVAPFSPLAPLVKCP